MTTNNTNFLKRDVLINIIRRLNNVQYCKNLNFKYVININVTLSKILLLVKNVIRNFVLYFLNFQDFVRILTENVLIFEEYIPDS